MPLPANVTTVTVLGTFLTPEGEPSTGTVSFTPSSWLTNSGANVAIPNSSVVKTLGTAGSFSAVLPITDDPDLSPGGWVYGVSEVVDGVSQSYNILIPGTVAVGGTVFLADLVPAAPAGPEYYSLASSLAIGTVTTVATGGSATATITGLAPSQVLNLGIPVGATGTVASAGSGSVGTAAVAPQGDPDTGIYFPAPNQVGITAGGSAAAIFAAGAISNPTFTGVASFPDGSASAPSITNTGDTNTGLFHPAEDTVAISTGGTERLRVTSAGLVQLSSSASFAPQIIQTNTNTDANGSFILLRKVPSDNIISAEDNLGVLQFQGADTSGTARNAALVQSRAQSQGATFVEGRLELWTTNSSGSSTEKFRIDGNGLITGTGTSLGAWTAYTPTLAGTGWAIGNGTVNAAYCQVGKIVHWVAYITFGSTSTFGGADGLTVSLPVNRPGGRHYTVSGYGLDVSAGIRVPVMGYTTSTSSVLLYATDTQDAYLLSTRPFTWANGDIIAISGTHEAA